MTEKGECGEGPGSSGHRKVFATIREGKFNIKPFSLAGKKK